MGGDSNPMQAHHRKQRKRQVQKNKQQRIKARDERVVDTKTVASIQAEIKNLKYRKNLQTAEQQKLQRLEKELKLVREAASQKPKSNWQAPREQHNPPTELDDPRKSVYYHETLNPYGVPPPGKPRLYHQRGGGVTMDIKYAIVPGEEPPPPPPPPRERDSHINRREESPHRRSRSRSPSPTGHSLSPEPAPIGEKEETKAEEQKVNKALTIPSLPPPSKAVQRSRRKGGNSAADIWASTEEVEYERRTNHVDLEADDVGAVALKKKKKAKKKKPPLEFYYKDMSEQVQGPFQKAQMREWIQAGFFPPTILVKTSRTETWKPIAEVQALQEAPPQPSPDKTDEAVRDRIAALRQDTSLNDRIDALKRRNQGEKDGEEEDTVDSEASASGLEDRVAALRRALAQGMSKNNDSSDEPEVSSPGNETTPNSVPPRPTGDDTDVVPYPVENEPGLFQVEDNAFPAPYPVEEEAVPYPVDDAVGPAAYPVDDETVPYPVDDAAGPAPYPADDDPAPYPVDNSAGPAPYPVDDEPAPYPVDDAVGPAPYPVDDVYPSADQYPAADPNPPNDAYPADVPYPMVGPYPGTEEGSSYPVVDAYPATGSYPDASDVPHNATEPNLSYPVGPAAPPGPLPVQKKTIKVDKDVVAFLPSHLRNRKRKPLAKTVQPKTKKMKVVVEQTKDDAGDDYTKFMDEIEGL